MNQELIVDVCCYGITEAPENHNLYLSLVMRNPAFCICENKDADQLCGKCQYNEIQQQKTTSRLTIKN